MAERTCDLVLFDLGGVLIDPGGVRPMRELSGIGSDEELWTRWLGCPWVRTFESGRCTAEEFAAGIVDDWALEVEPAAFLDEFGRWPQWPYPGAAELLAQVREAVPVGFLSNANVFQWNAHYEAIPLTHDFDHRFLSFELGMVKPDREIFDAVAARLAAPTERVLFLDDNAMNVRGAEAAGFTAVHVQGVAESHRALVSAGILPA